MADEKGHLTDRLKQVYLDLARGGVATIITGYAFIIENEQPNPGMMGIYNDSFIKEYSELTEMVKKEGANIIMQIVYGGSATSFHAPPDLTSIGKQGDFLILEFDDMTTKVYELPIGEKMSESHRGPDSRMIHNVIVLEDGLGLFQILAEQWQLWDLRENRFITELPAMPVVGG